MSNIDLVGYFLLSVSIILLLARVMGMLAETVGQPRVVGEIVAGLLLGPTLLGQELSLIVVPAEVRPILGAVATLALALFMFIAGVEYDLEQTKGRGSQAGLLAVLGVLIPALAGFPIARLLFTPVYAGPAATDLLPFALFIGAALSVTAFPVMAHILMERGELNTRMGSLGIASTGIMSILMFSYISFAAAVATASGLGDFLVQTVLVFGFVGLSWFGVRPILRRVLPGESVAGDRLALCFGGLIVYALIAHLLGINAMIGGFLWGMILPANRALRASLTARVRDFTTILFLPIFFAMAGFQADLKLMTADTLPAIALMLAGAIGSKFLAALPARAFGITLREAGVLGALFNTRGLLVLVAGLIGLQAQIITGVTFTIIVVVALVTNLMTVPLLNALSGGQAPFAPVADRA
ncbi:MAG TPA: cation:proton antiporter, partial [Anaerolineales bacterium]|nr:cation:proton antiporter [Anaerolineales bacterium]